jgi:LuxR family maltose regulon positive regulatory protein
MIDTTRFTEGVEGMTGRSALTEDPDGLSPLAEAKLALPCTRRGATVERRRVFELLDRSSGAKLLLVAAPAGFGKTTAVAEWCAARPAACAWVTLDTADNDPNRYWTYAATAIDRVRRGLGRSALHRLERSRDEVEPAIDELMNGLSAFAGEIVLVFDDGETVTDPECAESLAYALDRLPANACIVVLSRVMPSLPLARLRARGDLVEIGPDDLSFTLPEAVALLNGCEGLELDEPDVATLLRRTDGWPAALVLAAMSIRSASDRHQAVDQFGGHHRAVADYLGEEVLASLNPDVRDLVARLSVLRQFTAAMSDEVLEQSDSAALLDDLERTRLLVPRAGNEEWFTVQPFVARFASSRLDATQPDAAARIHSRAVSWLRSHGLAELAVEQALIAGDDAAVAEILEENHLAWIREGRSRMCLEWTEALPEGTLLQRPRLAAAASVAATLVGQGTIARRRFLQMVDQARAEGCPGIDSYVDALDSMIRSGAVEGDVGRAISHGRHAVELSEQAVDEVRVAALAGYAQALYFGGEDADAWECASRAVEHPNAEHRPLGHAFARSTLALIAIERQRLPLARTHLERARAALGSIGSTRGWLGAQATTASGCLLAAEGELAAAERELATAEVLFRDEVSSLHHVWVLLLLARVRCRRGRIREGGADLAAGQSELADLADPGRIRALADDVAEEIETTRGRATAGEVIGRPSRAEVVVLRLLATDLSTTEIAEHLHLSPNTVRSHIRAVYRKLGVSNRADAVARADALGLLN